MTNWSCGVAPPARERVVPPAQDPQQWNATPIVATEAVALVDQLVTAERAVRDPAVTGLELAFMSHLQQLVYRQLIVRPELRDAVFAAIPADVRAAADLNFAASADLWPFGTRRAWAGSAATHTRVRRVRCRTLRASCCGMVEILMSCETRRTCRFSTDGIRP